MAYIKVHVDEKNKEAVLRALSIIGDKVVSTTSIGAYCNLKPSAVRYALMELEEEGKIVRHRVKAFNKHYIRYKYSLVI